MTKQNNRLDKKGAPLRKREVDTWQQNRGIKSLLQGKVFCSCCEHVLKLSYTKNAAFHCDFTRSAADAACYRLKMLVAELEKILLGCVRKHARDILKNADAKPAPVEEAPQLSSIEDAKFALYERYVLGEIGADDYKAEKSMLDAEFERIKNIYAILSKQAAQQASVQDVRQTAEDVRSARKLSQSVVAALVDRVNVYPGGKVEIIWKTQGFDAVVCWERKV